MKSRNVCWTLNNWNDVDISHICGLDVTYMVFGKEVGESGTPHLQGFAVFKNQISLSAANKRLGGRAHCEYKKGTFEQASAYCKKDGDFHESGALPMDQVEKGKGEKRRYEEAWELAKTGDIESIDADIRMRHYSTIKRIRADYQQVPASVSELDFWWFVGSSGTGKSSAARQENPGYYIKNKNKWWDGYVDQPCVIIEEWSPSVVDGLRQMLKEWCDHHPFAAEVKGGTSCIRPPKIIITSNYTMEECFGEDTVGLLQPLMRRIKIREF